MGKPHIKTSSEDYKITDGVTTHYFPTGFDERVARYFLNEKAFFLYALAVDFPGLYKIPLCYREAARKALKEVGFKTSRPKWETSHSSPWVMLYFMGPKRQGSGIGTLKEDATSFKIWFGRVGGLL